MVSGRSGAPSPDVPIEPGTPGDCETSMNRIVLVSRVIIDASRRAIPRVRASNDGPFPLPFIVADPCQLRARAKVVGERHDVNAE